MIAIVDYGMGNVGSVKNALAALGYDARVSHVKGDLQKATHIILPGVGAFGDGMKNLKAAGCLKVLEDEVLKKKKPFLGICLGMEMLANFGEEEGKHAGLGWITGVSRKFKTDKPIRIPHIGWNDIKPQKNALLFKGVKRPIFYFVHSYHLVPKNHGVVVATCDYGERFVAACQKDNIFGVQFHPEKSQAEGLRILKNFLGS